MNNQNDRDTFVLFMVALLTAVIICVGSVFVYMYLPRAIGFSSVAYAAPVSNTVVRELPVITEYESANPKIKVTKATLYTNPDGTEFIALTLKNVSGDYQVVVDDTNTRLYTISQSYDPIWKTVGTIVVPNTRTIEVYYMINPGLGIGFMPHGSAFQARKD